MKIVIHPDPVLEQVCSHADPSVHDDTVREMIGLMYAANGAGLAAPQVGITRRFFVMNASGVKGMERVFFNPVLHRARGKREYAIEGCLSLPDRAVKVLRFPIVLIEYEDSKGRKKRHQSQSPWEARVMQHEMDHLDGKLIGAEA